MCVVCRSVFFLTDFTTCLPLIQLVAISFRRGLWWRFLWIFRNSPLGATCLHPFLHALVLVREKSEEVVVAGKQDASDGGPSRARPATASRWSPSSAAPSSAARGARSAQLQYSQPHQFTPSRAAAGRPVRQQPARMCSPRGHQPAQMTGRTPSVC